MERRKFVATAAGALAVGATSVAQAPNVIAQPKLQWRMATTWPPAVDILYGGSQRFARIVEELSGGRFKIEVFAAGELVPAFSEFDACSQGNIDMFNSVAYYWAAREPAFHWFGGVPFGLNAQATYAWCYYGGGLKLWEEACAPFGLLPRLGGSPGVQMGGWFRKKINRLADFKGLKLRMAGLGGKVLARAGATAMVLPTTQAVSALQQGVIDAIEFVGPHDDLNLGIYRGARYYYYPGWHEPGAASEFTFNKRAYDALPAELRRVLDYAAMAVSTLVLAEYEAKNALALRRLRTELKDKVEVLEFPREVVKELKKLAAEVLKEEAEKTPMARKVYASYTHFQSIFGDWGRTSEGAYHALIAG